MIRQQLEKEFTSMLVRTDTQRAYSNLAWNYFRVDDQFVILTMKDSKEKLKQLREGDPKDWITKIFTEGLDIPAKLYQVNMLWLKHLEETTWQH